MEICFYAVESKRNLIWYHPKIVGVRRSEVKAKEGAGQIKYPYATFYHKSIKSKSLPKIFNFINKHFVSSVTDIRLVDKWQRFLVNDQHFPNALDLTDYGEGLQRVFFISLTFAAAQNGVVLIDEFENAIHTGDLFF